ncbi:MAG: FAD-dependent oxidoreductase [Deltaproteobacteria bacterium]|nr:FAD-dependent oxidoreductase [Deltaproteobacteria bacterium]
MKTTDVAIIGGSAAGLMAAVTLKRLNPARQVTIIRNASKALVPCGIPYIYGFLGDVAKDVVPDDNFLKMGLEFIVKTVTAIDREKQVLTFEDGETLSYNKLLLGTGSKPIMPPMPGIDLRNVFPVRKSPEYLQELLTALENAKNVVVIGGGFIGVEMAEQVAVMGGGRRITVIEMLPHCLMLACEEEYCLAAEAALEKLGIEVMTNCRVEAIEGSDRAAGVKLADGQVLPADVVIVGIGAAPNIELAAQAGLEADPRGGIKVNEYLETSDPAILAAGDCASKFSLITGKPCGIRLASVACSEGMIAAWNIDGRRRKTMGALGAFATKIGDLTIAAAGLTSKAAADEGIEVVVGEAVAPNRHPGGLPGCVPEMKAKLLFRKADGVIVGGHVCGGEGAADMVNIVAVAIQDSLTAEQLATMQYATHPLLTASPLFYHVMLAAENASIKLAAS